MHVRSLSAALATVVAALSCTGFAFADDPFEWPELPYEPCYRIERVIQPSDVCPQGGTSILGYAINSHGTIVGTAKCTGVGPTLAFIWRMNGPFQWISLPAGTTHSWATKINDSGWVAGHFHNSSLGERGFLWNEQSGEFHVIAPPDGFISIRPTGINARGTIVGDVQPPLQPAVGFIWESGSMTLLRDLYDFKDRSHIPTDICDDGTITGYFADGINGTFLARPFLIKNNGLFEVDHPYPGGWQGTAGMGLLPGDRFVGEAWSNPKLELGTTIVFGDESGYLGEFSRPDHYWRTAPLGTNSAADIVGAGTMIGSGPNEAILVRDGSIQPLRDFVIDGVPFNPTIARGISANGQITAGPHHLVPAPPPPGDLSRNCRRDINDLLLLLAQWGPGKDVPADLNGDGRVDLQDVLLLLNFIAEDFSR